MGNIPLGKSVKSPLSIIKNIINVADTDKGKTFKNKEVNGKIDKDFNQGHLGDCALLSTLYGFSRTKEGAQAIEDALVELTDDAGDVTGYQVTFDKGDDDKNNDEIYTITKQELEAAKNGTNGRQYSKGDDDVTLLELALEKSFNQSQDPVLRNLVDNYTSVNADDKLNGVNPASVTYLFTGDVSANYLVRPEDNISGRFTPVLDIEVQDSNGETVKFQNGVTYKMSMATDASYVQARNLQTDETIKLGYNDFISKVLKPDAQKSKEDTQKLFDNFNPNEEMLLFATSTGNVIIGKSSDGSPVTGVDVKGSDGNNVQLIAPHAYAVKSISNGVVSLMDPNDSSKVIQVKQESLLGLEKFHAYSLPVE